MNLMRSIHDYYKINEYRGIDKSGKSSKHLCAGPRERKEQYPAWKSKTPSINLKSGKKSRATGAWAQASQKPKPRSFSWLYKQKWIVEKNGINLESPVWEIARVNFRNIGEE